MYIHTATPSITLTLTLTLTGGRAIQDIEQTIDTGAPTGSCSPTRPDPEEGPRPGGVSGLQTDAAGRGEGEGAEKALEEEDEEGEDERQRRLQERRQRITNPSFLPPERRGECRRYRGVLV